MKYKIIYQENGKVVSKKIESKNLDDEVLPLNIIEIKKEFTFKTLNNKMVFISQKQLKLIFYELNLMLQSKILLDEALDILIKKEKKNSIIGFLKILKNSFTTSGDISKSLAIYKVPYIIKAFFQIMQKSGNSVENIEFLSRLIEEDYEIRKDFKKVLAYPIILLITYLIALIGIFRFVIPKFEFIFVQNKIEYSFATSSLLFVKDFFVSFNILFLSIPIVLVFLLYSFYKNNKKFRVFIHKISMEKLSLFSCLYKYRTYYTLFSTLEIFLSSKYEFHESFSKMKVLINNQYLLDKITHIDSLLKNGKSISYAFDSVEIFDEITVSLLKTGEITNSLETTIGEIKKINKKRFDDKLKLFSLLVEPIFFLIMMLLILWIIIAIFVPLWSMGDMLKM